MFGSNAFAWGYFAEGAQEEPVTVVLTTLVTSSGPLPTPNVATGTVVNPASISTAVTFYSPSIGAGLTAPVLPDPVTSVLGGFYFGETGYDGNIGPTGPINTSVQFPLPIVTTVPSSVTVIPGGRVYDRILFLGNSITEGDIGAAGHDNWAGFAFEVAAALGAIGYGFRSVGLSGNRPGGGYASYRQEWTFAGTWTQSPGPAVAPFNESFYATGAANTLTWSVPSLYFNGSFLSFNLVFRDIAGGGHWSYSLDGGTTWIQMGQSLAGDNSLKSFFVVPPGAITEVIVRAADGSGAAVLCEMAGITPYYSALGAAASGPDVHDLGRSGATLFASGAPTAFYQGSNPGSMSILSILLPNPTANDVVVVEFYNDDRFSTDTATWQTALKAIISLVAPAQVLFINLYDAVNNTNEALYRTATSQVAATYQMPVLDLYQQWSSTLGLTGYPADSVLLSDGTHPNVSGHDDIANRLEGILQPGAPIVTTTTFPQPIITAELNGIITLRQTNNTALVSSVSSLALLIPTAPKVGDLLRTQIWVEKPGQGFPNVVTPTGWQLVGAGLAAGARYGWVYSFDRVADGTETVIVFNWTGAGQAVAAFQEYQGWLGTPTRDISSYGSTNSTTSFADPAGGTLLSPNAELACSEIGFNSAIAGFTPSGCYWGPVLADGPGTVTNLNNLLGWWYSSGVKDQGVGNEWNWQWSTARYAGVVSANYYDLINATVNLNPIATVSTFPGALMPPTVSIVTTTTFYPIATVVPDTLSTTTTFPSIGISITVSPSIAAVVIAAAAVSAGVQPSAGLSSVAVNAYDLTTTVVTTAGISDVAISGLLSAADIAPTVGLGNVAAIGENSSSIVAPVSDWANGTWLANAAIVSSGTVVNAGIAAVVVVALDSTSAVAPVAGLPTVSVTSSAVVSGIAPNAGIANSVWVSYQATAAIGRTAFASTATVHAFANGPSSQVQVSVGRAKVDIDALRARVVRPVSEVALALTPQAIQAQLVLGLAAQGEVRYGQFELGLAATLRLQQINAQLGLAAQLRSVNGNTELGLAAQKDSRELEEELGLAAEQEGSTC